MSKLREPNVGVAEFVNDVAPIWGEQFLDGRTVSSRITVRMLLSFSFGLMNALLSHSVVSGNTDASQLVVKDANVI